MKLIVEDLPRHFRYTNLDDGRIEIISTRCKVKIKFPIVENKELAFLIGHVLGDGHIKENESQFQYFNKNKGLIDEIKSVLKNLFDIELREHFRKSSGIYELYSPSIIARILVLLGATKGRKSSKNMVIPEWIKNGSSEIKSYFLRALFDDEGWVETTQGGFVIGFGQNKKWHLIESHREYIKDMQRMLLEFGVITSNIYKRSQVGDSIQLGFKIIGYDNIKKFLNNIGFSHNLKQEKLLHILNSYKQIQYSKREAKLKVWEALQDGQLRSKQLGILLNRDQKTIWKHLHHLHKKNLVTKIGTKNKVFWKINYINNINPNIKE